MTAAGRSIPRPRCRFAGRAAVAAAASLPAALELLQEAAVLGKAVEAAGGGTQHICVRLRGYPSLAALSNSLLCADVCEN